MRTVRSLSRQAISSVAAISALVTLVVPGLVPAFASAASLTSRSIDMSNSTADAGSVTYDINFTPSGSAFQSVAIDWCSNTPVEGDSCTAPSGFDAKTGVTIGTGTTSFIGTAAIDATDSTANHTVITGSSSDTTATAVTIELDGVHNPTSAGTFYARVYTYNLATPDWTAATTPGTVVDNGGVALSATSSVGVNASVQETMTFCVSAAAPTSNCTGTSAPNVTLGEAVTGGGYALNSANVSTGAVYAQISTNAASGAIVNLKNNNTCGGLKLFGASGCDIAPQSTSGTGITAGQALFGVTVGTAAAASDAGGNANGTFEAANSSGYDATHPYMNYVSGGASGVTSPYGSPLLDTASKPINDMNIPVTFSASISNSTPAGNYSATMDMVATGTF